ncbi:MAG: Serine hydroxymethyltransferase [Anaerolineae bacterium]|jgi:glycine hydroxymethyltransferase|nr:MAG: Serine hydroxymethyltransferase [Anaerolineae bacterium]
MSDYLFRGSVADFDCELKELLDLEAERQVRKLILIPSESTAPLAVREILSSAFQNIYAEGYPPEESRKYNEKEIFDYDFQLAAYRRYSDPRYYKGVEYADIVEMLARRRCAELFANERVGVDELYVNVQALSGAPANNAVFHALLNPGDPILGMSLLHGGHLTHGSSVNRSGKFYQAYHYTVDPETEQINYESIQELAEQVRPKIIIAGYSSYPWAVDWERFAKIAHSVGAYLMADIAHVAGLVAAGVYPSPVGFADVITFTTHKSLCGPRGACILTTDPGLAKKIDRAVFPGEQGGPHVNTFAAMALAFKLARTEQFRQLQSQVVKNCASLTERLQELGCRISYGGTNTHLTNLDCRTFVGADGTSLSGDQAARILDIAGIVVNRNTIPGDNSAADPSGIRMGTPWVTQRGFKEEQMRKVAELIVEVLNATRPYTYAVRVANLRRAKVDFDTLESVKIQVRQLAEQAGSDIELTRHGYPHYYFIDDTFPSASGQVSFVVKGDTVRQFLNYATDVDVSTLDVGEACPMRISTPRRSTEGILACRSEREFLLSLPVKEAAYFAAWLRALSDGFVDFDQAEGATDRVMKKLPGPVIVKEVQESQLPQALKTNHPLEKPYYIGMTTGNGEAKPDFQWRQSEGELKRTPLYDLHRQLGAKLIPFAGWEMPVWYSSVIEEHLATRTAAGLFDVAHMGVYQVEGTDAAAFLDSVCGNDIGGLEVGESCYTHFLDPDANVIDDTLVYRRALDVFLVVVNASNDDKDWAWLNAVLEGKVCIDRERPWARAFGRKARLRNLRDPREGEDMRVDLALQGPKSRDILLALGVDPETRKKILALKRTELCDAKIGGFDLIVSRTGYTGEKMAFELFVHPNRAAELFKTLLEKGEPFGIKPIGLGARDSLRTEAGLPLYGHEMGEGSGKRGERDLGVAEGGFGSYVKLHKPWFIGRQAFVEREKTRRGVVVRFQFLEKGVRMAHGGDPVLDKRGRVIGWVTSCAIDQQGTLTGQAYVELKAAEEGTHIYIYQGSPEKEIKAPAAMMLGEKSVLPSEAVVLSRFPK